MPVDYKALVADFLKRGGKISRQKPGLASGFIPRQPIPRGSYVR